MNKMDVQNLAIVFGPTLIRQHPSKETPMNMLENTEKSKNFVAAVLENYDAIMVRESVTGEEWPCSLR